MLGGQAAGRRAKDENRPRAGRSPLAAPLGRGGRHRPLSRAPGPDAPVVIPSLGKREPGPEKGPPRAGHCLRKSQSESPCARGEGPPAPGQTPRCPTWETSPLAGCVTRVRVRVLPPGPAGGALWPSEPLQVGRWALELRTRSSVSCRARLWEGRPSPSWGRRRPCEGCSFHTGRRSQQPPAPHAQCPFSREPGRGGGGRMVRPSSPAWLSGSTCWAPLHRWGGGASHSLAGWVSGLEHRPDTPRFRAQRPVGAHTQECISKWKNKTNASLSHQVN